MSLISEKINADRKYAKNSDVFGNVDYIARVFRQSGSFLFIGDNLRQMEAVVEILAKAEACSESGNAEQNRNYCGKCRDCQLIAARQHPDIHWLGPKGGAASIKIEDIRLLNEQINLKPFQAKRKIFIIQEAQRMGPEAANALLKTLEEPPQNASLVLISRSLAELLPTIVSRCKLVRFSNDGTDFKDDRQIIDQFVYRFLEQDEPLAEQNLYEDIGALDRSAVEEILDELARVMRDILIIGLCTDKVKFISAQSPEKIRQWSGLFNNVFIEPILEQVIDSKSNISRNANIKLAIDLLVKSINQYRVKNN